MPNYNYWKEELFRVDKRQPHDPWLCQSIASSGPIQTWYCSRCHQTYLNVMQPTCHGGCEDRRNLPQIFGSREENLLRLERIERYSKETGTEAGYETHRRWLSTRS